MLAGQCVFYSADEWWHLWSTDTTHHLAAQQYPAVFSIWSNSCCCFLVFFFLQTFCSSQLFQEYFPSEIRSTAFLWPPSFFLPLSLALNAHHKAPFGGWPRPSRRPSFIFTAGIVLIPWFRILIVQSDRGQLHVSLPRRVWRMQACQAQAVKILI